MNHLCCSFYKINTQLVYHHSWSYNPPRILTERLRCSIGPLLFAGSYILLLSSWYCQTIENTIVLSGILLRFKPFTLCILKTSTMPQACLVPPPPILAILVTLESMFLSFLSCEITENPFNYSASQQLPPDQIRFLAFYPELRLWKFLKRNLLRHLSLYHLSLGSWSLKSWLPQQFSVLSEIF